MANKVTGSTNTTGALAVIPTIPKCVIIVAKKTGTPAQTVADKTIVQISSTSEAEAIFGLGTVSEMVRIMIMNGVNNIKGIIIPADGDTALVDTLAVTLADKTIKCIITPDNDAETIAAMKDHLLVAESNDLFRYSAFSPSADIITQEAITTFVNSIDSDRIFAPAQLANRIVNGVTTLALPQVVSAGLVSAIMTGTDDPALPLSGVELNGFSGISRIMLNTEMDILVNAGAVPLYEEGTTPTIYRLVTTKNADKIFQEGTTRFIADYVLETISNVLRSKYKRTKNVTRILDSIKDDVREVLEATEALEIIENLDISTLSVVQDPDDRYGALVSYDFDVITPLYTITINQSLKL